MTRKLKVSRKTYNRICYLVDNHQMIIGNTIEYLLGLMVGGLALVGAFVLVVIVNG